MRLLRVFNRQKSRKLNAAPFRQMTRHLLETIFDASDYELGIHLIDAKEMAKLNHDFLGHTGSTDVITFNHQEANSSPFLPRSGGEGRGEEAPAHPSVYGEIFICINDAIAQALEFHSTWQSEIMRYVAHGLLHLQGHDDLTPGPRRAMKREENKLVKDLSRRFDLGKLGGAKRGSRHE